MGDFVVSLVWSGCVRGTLVGLALTGAYVVWQTPEVPLYVAVTLLLYAFVHICGWLEAEVIRQARSEDRDELLYLALESPMAAFALLVRGAGLLLLGVILTYVLVYYGRVWDYIYPAIVFGWMSLACFAVALRDILWVLFHPSPSVQEVVDDDTRRKLEK